MSEQRVTFNESTRVLYRQAIRTPLPNEDAERLFHENMMNTADAQERKADILADSDISLFEAYKTQLEGITKSYKRRCRRIAGDDYEEIAMAYNRGARDDRVGTLTAYYFEGLWRVQQRVTVTDMLFFPIILRYPDCFTINVRFASGHATTESVLYGSPEHSTEEPDDECAGRYYNESLYSQKEAAEYTRDTAEIICEEFPSPDESTLEERQYGGITSVDGRKGPVFSSMLKQVEPNPNRFSEPVDQPVLVEGGKEARQTERELLPGDAIVL